MRNKRSKRGPSYPPEVKGEALKLRANKWPPKAITEELARLYPEWKPPISTVKRWIAELPPEDPDATPWDFANAEPEDRRIVARYFAARSRPGAAHPVNHWPSQEVAAWWVRLWPFHGDDIGVPAPHLVELTHWFARDFDDQARHYLAEMLRDRGLADLQKGDDDGE